MFRQGFVVICMVTEPVAGHTAAQAKISEDAHNKTKRKDQKSKSSSKQYLEEAMSSTAELAEKTVGSLGKLGTQILLSPFSNIRRLAVSCVRSCGV